MFRPLLFAICAAFAAGAAHATPDDDFVKESIDATRPAQIDLAPDGSVAPHDLSLDTDFDPTGSISYWPPGATGWTTTDDGLRVFPWVGTITLPGPPPISYTGHKGYYIVGKQKSSSGTQWRGWIARVSLAGGLDTTFGTNGWIYTIGQDDIVDATIVGAKAYLLTNIWSTTAAPPATRINCIDLATPTGSDCFPALAGVQTWDASTAGPRTAAYGQRLVHDSRYGLFVAARIINSTRGQEVGIARVNADTGALVAEFRDGGYNIGLPTWAGPTGQVDVQVNDLVVTPTDYPGGTRLYVAGQARRTTTDWDGFILGLGPTNGTTGSGWNWNDKSIYYERDNTGDKQDSVTALAVLRNGKIAFAGWSETDDATVRPMIMGSLKANGDSDASFCDGNANQGETSCLVNPPYSSGSPLFIDYKPFSLPVALAERRQNRDLVVAQRFQNNGGSPVIPDDHRVRTLVQQFSANGNRIHAERTIDIPGSGSSLWSRPFSMWMGGTGLWSSTEGGLGEELITIVGTRLWSGNDYDATLSQLRATDSIFADAFGGKYSD